MTNQSKEDSHPGNRLTAFLAGLLLGGLAGAAAMLFWAPRSGKQTRSQIQKDGTKLRHQAIEGMEEMVSDAGDKAHELTESVNKSVNKGLGELQQHAQELLGEGKKK